MANDGRIILVGRPDSDVARAPAQPPRPPVTAQTAPRGAPARPPASAPRASGWTVGRLVNGAALSFVATVVGGLIFQKNFQLFGDNNRQLLAAGFGLFVVGMVVLTLCLIGIAARGVHKIVAGQGWGAAVLLGYAPAIPLVLLNMIGVLSYAFPALFLIIVSGGFALALKQR